MYSILYVHMLCNVDGGTYEEHSVNKCTQICYPAADLQSAILMEPQNKVQELHINASCMQPKGDIHIL